MANTAYQTNEELVKAIREGREDLIPELWEQVVPFIKYMAGKRIKNIPEEKKDLFDDMVNEAYFVFLGAVKSYEETGSLFITFFKFYLKNAFTNVLYGGRTQKRINDLLNTAISMDKPLSTSSGSEDFTLADILVDPLAEQPYRDIEEASYWNAMHYKLRQEICDVKMNPNIRRTLLYQLEHGSTPSKAREALGVKVDYQAYNEALRRLRTRLKVRRRTDEDLAEAIPVRGYSVKRFKERGYTSLVEQLAIERADRELFYKRMREGI